MEDSLPSYRSMMVSISDGLILHYFCCLFFQLLIFLVNSFFNHLDHAIGKVTKPSLKFDIFLDGPQLGEVDAQMIPAPLNLIEGKDPCLHSHPAQFDR